MKDRYAAQNMCYNIKGRAKSLKAASMCCLLALSSPCTMQAQNDSVPHLQKSALEYMLQVRFVAFLGNHSEYPLFLQEL